MSLDRLLHDIVSGPRGPEIGAFFDFDGTVISGYSASAFYGHRLRSGEMGLGELARTVKAGLRGVNSEAEFLALLEVGSVSWVGRTEAELAALGEKLFRQEIAGRLHSEVWELVQATTTWGTPSYSPRPPRGSRWSRWRGHSMRSMCSARGSRARTAR